MDNIKEYSPILLDIIKSVTSGIDPEQAKAINMAFAITFQAGRSSGMSDVNLAIEAGAAMEEAKSSTIH